MNPALAAVALVPGLALGSFLNVVAARVPLRRSVVKPASACMSCGHDARLVRQHPARSRTRSSAAAAAPAARRSRGSTRSSSSSRDCSSPRASSSSGFTWDAAVASFFCATLVAVSVTDLERRIIPNKIVLPAAAVVLAAQTLLHPSPEWVLAGLAASAFLLVAALAYPAGMGMGDVKLALLLGVMLGRVVPVALMVGMVSALVPAIVLLAQHGQAGAEDGNPVRPVPRVRRPRRPLCRGSAPRRVPEPALMKSPGMNFDNHPELRLVNDDGGDQRRHARRTAAEERGHSELVSEVIGETGLLPPEKLEQVRTQAVGGILLAGADRRGLRERARRRPHARRAVPPAARRPRRRRRRRRGVEDDRAAGARARLRDSVRQRRRDAQARDHRPAERAGPRRAAARDAPADRVLRRGEERRPHRAAPPLARVRGAQRRLRRRRPPPRQTRKRRRTTSRPTTGSPTRRSSGSSTRSSSRPPRRARATSTSSRRSTS